MRCENCDRPLPEGSDPLCVPCLHELRAGPWGRAGPDETIGQAIRRILEGDLDPDGGQTA